MYSVYSVAPNLSIHNPPIPQPLPEVPAETGEAIKEAELEEVADAEIGDSAKIAREFVIFRLARIGPDTGPHALHRTVELNRQQARPFMLDNRNDKMSLALLPNP